MADTAEAGPGPRVQGMCLDAQMWWEFGRLAQAVGVDTEGDTGKKGCQALANALGGVMVVRKGGVDWISDGTDERTVTGEGEGGRKRSGGQGDTLTGSIGTLLAWEEYVS